MVGELPPDVLQSLVETLELFDRGAFGGEVDIGKVGRRGERRGGKRRDRCNREEPGAAQHQPSLSSSASFSAS